MYKTETRRSLSRAEKRQSSSRKNMYLRARARASALRAPRRDREVYANISFAPRIVAIARYESFSNLIKETCGARVDDNNKAFPRAE